MYVAYISEFISLYKFDWLLPIDLDGVDERKTNQRDNLCTSIFGLSMLLQNSKGIACYALRIIKGKFRNLIEESFCKPSGSALAA